VKASVPVKGFRLRDAKVTEVPKAAEAPRSAKVFAKELMRSPVAAARIARTGRATASLKGKKRFTGEPPSVPGTEEQPP
jgi:hypothetical protein